jgi:hypothetical protein
LGFNIKKLTEKLMHFRNVRAENNTKWNQKLKRYLFHFVKRRNLDKTFTAHRAHKCSAFRPLSACRCCCSSSRHFTLAILPQGAAAKHDVMCLRCTPHSLAERANQGRERHSAP